MNKSLDFTTYLLAVGFFLICMAGYFVWLITSLETAILTLSV